MARPRVNDPAGTRSPPNFVTNPDRKEEIVREFKARLVFLETNYLHAKEWLGDQTYYNLSLKRLRKVIRVPAAPGAEESRIHPEIEIVISHHARRFAAGRAGEGAQVQQQDIERAARHASRTLRTRRGAPADRILRHHVEGLMALVQRVTGSPVLVERMRGQDYDPHFKGECGRVVLAVMRTLEPEVPERKIARMVLDARKRIGGGPMRFSDYFPGYGMRPGPDGTPIAPPGLAIEHFEYAFPIYCPN